MGSRAASAAVSPLPTGMARQANALKLPEIRPKKPCSTLLINRTPTLTLSSDITNPNTALARPITRYIHTAGSPATAMRAR